MNAAVRHPSFAVQSLVNVKLLSHPAVTSGEAVRLKDGVVQASVGTGLLIAVFLISASPHVNVKDASPERVGGVTSVTVTV